jgi:hypothetical protein
MVDIGSESDDDIGTEQEDLISVKPKASVKASTKPKQPTAPKPKAKKEEIKNFKGKGKVTIDDVEMAVESDEPRVKMKRPAPIPASSIGNKRPTDPEALIKENERLRNRVAEVGIFEINMPGLPVDLTIFS